jgi:hypothetical protein
MLSDQQLIEIQARALFTHDEDSRLVLVNEPGEGTTPAPSMFLGRTSAGNIWRFRHDLPAELVSELESICADEPISAELLAPPRHTDLYVRLLKEHGPVNRIGAGPAYSFTEYPEPARPISALTLNDAETLGIGFEDLGEELPNWQPFFAAVENGRAISICRSVRITKEAHEAGVETLPPFRGRGFAVDVTAAWARRVRELGAIPLYSTSRENSASQSVARKLRLRLFGADFHIA